MKALVLAEKPSVAREIARVLGCSQKAKNYIEGANYVVTWALGHLVELAEPEDYDPKYQTWRLEDLPIIPDRMKLKVIRETSAQFKAIAQLAKRTDLTELIIATDAGREGELVARWIMELIKWKKPFKRLWISSQTDQAIREGFSRLKPGHQYDPLFQSAICRAEADWLIGLNVTRALTSKYNAQLSAGRVQTPTLAMMIEREQQIRGFKSIEYRTVACDFGQFSGAWRSPTQPDGRLFDLTQAEAIRNKVHGQTGKVTRLKTTEKWEQPPLPHDLTELQRDANRRYGFSAKQTSNVLQKLYEQHKIVTYPRTDSRYLSSDIVPTFKARLDSMAVGPYAALAKSLLRNTPLTAMKRAIDNSKVSDHHAIIPTEQFVNLSALSADERKLYDLIARRFLALFNAPFRYDETALVVEVSGEAFHASGRVVKDPGWKQVYGEQWLDEDGDEADSKVAADETGRHQLLPSLTIGQQLKVKLCSEQTRFTRPPDRYTEATLLSQMEKHNLGTPATRADIIEKLVASDTIERQSNRLNPTGKGLQLIELAADDLRSPELTAAWELKLEAISKGKQSPQQFIADIREQTIRLVREVKNTDKEYKPHNLTNSKCPDCGQPLQEIKGKRGKMLVCIDRECGFRRSAEQQVVNRRCPQCHKKMELHTGKAGKYVQCRHCNIVETLNRQSGGKIDKRQTQQLIRKYSKSESLSSSLGDALKAALEKQQE